MADTIKTLVTNQEQFAGTVTDDVDCHSTYCRVTATHDSYESQNAFPQLPLLMGETVAGWRTNSPNGDIKTVAYVVREGQSASQHPVLVMAGRGRPTAEL